METIDQKDILKANLDVLNHHLSTVIKDLSEVHFDYSELRKCLYAHRQNLLSYMERIEAELESYD